MRAWVNNTKVPGLLMSRVNRQGSTTASHSPRLKSLCKFVSVRYVNSRKSNFHQLAYEFIEERKEGRAIAPLLQPRVPKLTGNL